MLSRVLVGSLVYSDVNSLFIVYEGNMDEERAEDSFGCSVQKLR